MLYKDKNQPVEKRVEDLISRMTLEEKVAQCCGDLPVSVIDRGKVDKDALREHFSAGLGRITQYSTVGLISPESIARISNEIQKFFVEETRLGIPVIFQSESLCGYPGAGGTLFPAMINVASTWEPELAEEMTRVIKEETEAVGIKQVMSPVIDVSRDPRWGRTYETFGEDPYLISQMGIHYIQGMQQDKENGVACIAKHFLGYAETQGGINMTAERIGDRELYEVFATPFEAAVKEADVDGMMASYSDVDGIPVIANKKIAKDLLRDTMGFEGMLTSDGAAVTKLYEFQKIGKSYEEAAFLAMRAGTDTEIPVGNGFRKLPEYVRAGKLDEKRIDEACRRVLTTKFKYGLFDHPYIDESQAAGKMSNEAKWNLVEKITEESITLLENKDNILPLSPAGKKIAVIGPHGGDRREPISGYTYPSYIEIIKAMNSDRDVSDITFNGVVDEQKKNEKSTGKRKTPFTSEIYSDAEWAGMGTMETVLEKEYRVRTLAEALADAVKDSGATVTYAEGCKVIDDSKVGFPEARKAAEDSDLVIMTLGGNCGWFGTTGGEGKDRQYLDLPGVQQQLLEEVAKAGKPMILILYGPGIFAAGWAKDHVQAIIQAWLPGVKGAEALTKVLLGEKNPGGKLPVTVPASVGQVPIYYNHRAGSGYDSEKGNLIMGSGYVDGTNFPLYYFGYGLSYTTFELSGFEIAKKQVATDGVITVSCKVKNTGEREGDETIQLYTHFKDAWVTRPVKQLSGFARVKLAAGEEKKVTFYLDTAQLGYYNEEMEFAVEPGRLDIMVGTSSKDIAFEDTIELTGEKRNLMGSRAYTCPTEVR